MLGSLQIDRLYLCEKYYGQKSTPGKFKFKKVNLKNDLTMC